MNLTELEEWTQFLLLLGNNCDHLLLRSTSLLGLRDIARRLWRHNVQLVQLELNLPARERIRKQIRRLEFQARLLAEPMGLLCLFHDNPSVAPIRLRNGAVISRRIFVDVPYRNRYQR